MKSSTISVRESTLGEEFPVVRLTWLSVDGRESSEKKASMARHQFTTHRAQQLALNGLGLVAPIAVDGSKAFLSTIKWLMVGLISVAAALMRDVARPFAAIVILLAASKLEQLAKWLDPKSETRIGSPRGTARRRSSNRSAAIQPAARARSAPRSHSSKSLVRADRGIGCMTPTRLAMRFPSELAAANARANSNDESGTQEGDILADDLSDLSTTGPRENRPASCAEEERWKAGVMNIDRGVFWCVTFVQLSSTSFAFLPGTERVRGTVHEHPVEEPGRAHLQARGPPRPVPQQPLYLEVAQRVRLAVGRPVLGIVPPERADHVRPVTRPPPHDEATGREVLELRREELVPLVLQPGRGLLPRGEPPDLPEPRRDGRDARELEGHLGVAVGQEVDAPV
ncbi:hypothetical protein THAOC_34304 [Thalassiosira oceanica]|uniref:Uncharacterized protein n=1 Tax=Thalassiosira oceanica TaxID=159749 RepID=K0RJY0_THAOC|nr:hypothetical protein THAOC_34304 [Thalassiosira oceanica]|eukprot:EJK47007.1 hypothetical protein THAOC_34304 [Thalassiosira oceanica]